MSPAAIASRSATGSSTLPELRDLPGSSRDRAVDPVGRHDKPEQRSARRSSCPGSTISATKTGIMSDPERRDRVGNGQDATAGAAPARLPSLVFIASGRPDSNRRPSDPQSDALTKLRHGPLMRPGQVADSRRRSAVCYRSGARRSSAGSAGGSARPRDEAPAQAVLQVAAVARRRGSPRRRRSRTSAGRRRPAWRSGGCPCAAASGRSRCAAWTTSFTSRGRARERPPLVEVEQQRRQCGARPGRVVAEVRSTVAFA